MPEDRDQLFERALARQLRAEPSGAPLCLDPEALAAYHEGMLSPEETAAAKSHLVECGRCQEILAQLEATQAVNEWAGEPARPIQAVPALARAASPATAPAGSAKRLEMPGRKSSVLRWAAPAGAVAAGLLLWIGAREFRSPQTPATEPAVQVADQRADGDRQFQNLPAKPQREPPAEKQKDKFERAEPRSAPERSLRDEKEDGGFFRSRSGRKSGAEGYRASPQASVPGPRAMGQAQALQQNEQAPASGRLDDKPRANRRQPKPAEEQSKELALAGQLSADAAAAPPPPPASPAYADSEAATRKKAETRAELPSKQEGGAEAKTENVQVEAKTDNLVQLEAGSSVVTRAGFSPALAKVASSPLVAAPGGKKLWSLGDRGEILHSTDRGRTWKPQQSGVATALSSGSAPSDKVCWIGGRDATLLRTTDGGEHWTPIRVPFAGDLGGIRATDAQRAVIWGPPGGPAYETSDGGASWRPAPRP